jgi:hypothetical protein
VVIAPGSTFTNGAPDVEVVTLLTSQTTASTQCAGNIVVGLSATIDFAYFIRLTADNATTTTTTTTTTVMAYIVDMSTGESVAQVDVTALMPTAANDSYTEVTARFSSSPLFASRSYWLPFCFTTITKRRLVEREGSAIGIAGVSASGGKTTVGLCEGGPSCKPEVESGTLATKITRSAATSSGGDDSTIMIAAGVAVPVVLVVAGLVAGTAAYIAYTRSKGRLGQQPPVRRRSSIQRNALAREVQCAHENDLFEMDTFSLRKTAEQQRKLNRGSWIDA